MTTAPVKQGDIIAGKYRVDRILGVGAMGIVVSARHLQLEEDVAIKFLLPDMMHNPEIVMRFGREARAAVKIKSPHVARVIDVGELETGAPYMVMEYLDGSDLAAWLERHGALSVEQAVEFVLQACEAIAEAHALGIVHRDLKPANLFVVQGTDGLLKVKVLDFGISKTLPGSSGPDLSMTKTATTMGSPLYMSPEQMESAKSVDTRTDIWAIGVILYELLTRTTPFFAHTLPDLVLKILSTEAELLRQRRPDAPPELEQIIATCLRKDRKARYLTVADLATALAPFATWRAKESIERISRVIRHGGQSPSFPPAAGSSGSQAPRSAGTGGSWSGTASRPATGRSRLLRNAALAVMTTGAVGYVALHGRAVTVSGVSPPGGSHIAESESAAATLNPTSPSGTDVLLPTAAPREPLAPSAEAPSASSGLPPAASSHSARTGTGPRSAVADGHARGAKPTPALVSAHVPQPAGPPVNDAYDSRK